MNWTSEYEPPPPRSAADDDDAGSGVHTENDGPGSPLDPSLFDGLFDDLTATEEGPAENAEPEEQDDHAEDPEDEDPEDEDPERDEDPEDEVTQENDQEDEDPEQDLEPVDYVELFDDLEHPAPPAPPQLPKTREQSPETPARSEGPESGNADTERADSEAPAAAWQITVADLAGTADDDQDPDEDDAEDPEDDLLPGDRLLLDAPIILPDATELAGEPASPIPVFDPVPPDDQTAAGDQPFDASALNDDFLSNAVPVAAAPTNQEYPLHHRERKSQLTAFAAATIIGAVLGIGVALIAYQLTSGDTQPGDASTPLIAEQTGQPDSTDPASPTIAEAAQPAGDAAGSARLTSIGFIAGTAELTEKAKSQLAETAALLTEADELPASITVRTFTEASAEANQSLSQSQAQAIRDYLESQGMSFSSVAVRGLGATPLSPAVPVQNFVVFSPGLRDGPAKATVASLSPFDVGVHPDTLELRPESVAGLQAVGEALSSGSAGTITLAGYSYDRPDESANKALAAAATEAARSYLVENYQIDPPRITTVNLGQLPYIIGSQAGSHVEVRLGPSASFAAAIGSLNHQAMVFSPGSARLSESSQAELARLAQLLIETEAPVVITVHTATERSEAANAELSTAQADVILSYLAAAGVSTQRIRVFGAGAIGEIRHDGLLSAVFITAVG